MQRGSGPRSNRLHLALSALSFHLLSTIFVENVKPATQTEPPSIQNLVHHSTVCEKRIWPLKLQAVYLAFHLLSMACLHHRCFLYLQLQQYFHYFLPSIPNDAEHTHSPKTGKKQSNCDPTSTWTAVLIRILFLLLKCIQDDYLTNCARMHIKCFCHPTKFTLILRTIMCANFYSQHLLVFPYPKILCPLSPQHVL